MKNRIEGLRQLGESMRVLSHDMRDKVSHQATASGASLIRKAIKERAPVDTGNMRAAVIVKRVRETKLTSEYVAGVRVGKTADVKAAKAGTGKLGKDAYYAKFVEYGTVKMTAKPFIRPAWYAANKQAADKIADTLAKRIAKASK